MDLVTYPKKATAQDQPTADSQERRSGGTPSRVSSNIPNAGRMPTNPAASGICAHP
ncbi:hypothetical protein EW026_g2670 [Hermanssonia centrifuga]|uniref:Uncharacterized protein n=1 Tax=Hermanssonia centrifuga TaxID=98765 RepID=A0A4S4KNL2_9APHY|nr:hypothetical protein EW026_g2670 [Hermanssonia centrifuga]